MGSPDAAVTLTVEAPHLPAKTTRALKDAARAVEYWLGEWHHLIGAALTRPMLITVTVSAATTETGRAVVSDGPFGDDGGEEPVGAVVTVSEDLLGEKAELHAQLLDRCMQVIVVAAERWPNDPPKKRWYGSDNPEVSGDSPEQENGALQATLALLEPSEMLIFGRTEVGVGGAFEEGLNAFHDLDEYMVARIHGTGLGVLADTTGCGSIQWIVELAD